MRVVYLGRRAGFDGKLVHGFAPEARPDGPGWFRFRRGGWVVGGIYEADGDVADDGHLTSLAAPAAWSGDRIDDEAQCAAWELLDRQAQQGESARLATARAKREPAYLAALAGFEPVMSCAKTRRDAERIADTVKWALLDQWHGQR